MFQVYISGNPIIDKTTLTGTLGIENKDTYNVNDQIIEIYLTADDTLLFDSGLLALGGKIETGTILQDLAVGNHNAYAVFYNVNSELDIIGKTTVNIIITVTE